MTYRSEWGTFPTQPPPGAKLGRWSLSPAGVDEPADPIASCYKDQGGGFYPEMGDPLANLWLMVLDGRLQTKQFVCPSDPARPSPADVQYQRPRYSANGCFLNFGAAQGKVTTGATMVYTCSYSVAYPWVPATGLPALWWSGKGSVAVVLAADIGPSLSPPLDDPTAPAGTPASNSKNHQGVGQNVLFSDSHVEFCVRNDVGPEHDNIYTASGNAITVKKGGKQLSATADLNSIADDTILVPARP